MNDPRAHNSPLRSLRVDVESVARWAFGLATFTISAAVVLFASLFVGPLSLDPLLLILAKMVVASTGVKLRVHGRENLDPLQTYLFLFNHINLFDHFFIYVALHRRLRGIEREDHFRWPVYGWLVKRIGMIPIPPRGDTARAIESLEYAKKMLASGMSIGMAPEGTRTETGELGPLKKGAFHLAVDTHAPIVPVVLVGAYEFNRKGDWHIYPRPIDIYIEKPISTMGSTREDIPRMSTSVRNVFLSVLKR